MDKLPHVIEQLRYTPGELKATLTGTLTEVSQADGNTKRKALRIGHSDPQNYILLENAPLQAWLKDAQMGQTTTLTGLLSLYRKQHYLWFLPKRQKQPKAISLKGRFLTTGNSLVFRNGADEYLVLENSLREKVENTKGYPQKEWAVKAMLTDYQGVKYLFLKQEAKSQKTSLQKLLLSGD